MNPAVRIIQTRSRRPGGVHKAASSRPYANAICNQMPSAERLTRCCSEGEIEAAGAFLRKTFRDSGHQLESYKVQPMDGKPSPHVVVIGAGFGGLLATRALARYPVRVTLIDRKNFHTFQPLLYQVATAGLSPGEIAAPIRWILRGQKNVEVLLGDVQDFDLSRKVVKLSDLEIPYDYLIVATGASHAYFGHDDWEPFAPGLK